MAWWYRLNHCYIIRNIGGPGDALAMSKGVVYGVHRKSGRFEIDLVHSVPSGGRRIPYIGRRIPEHSPPSRWARAEERRVTIEQTPRGTPVVLEERAARFPTNTALIASLRLDPRDRNEARPERVRAARLLTLGCWLALRRRLGYDPAQPWEGVIPISIEAVGAQVGLRDSDRKQAERLLRERELLIGSADQGFRLAANLFEPLPGAAALDWTWIAERLYGRAAALCVVHALALFYNGHDPAICRSLSELERETAYSRNAIRMALAEVEKLGVIERQDRAGITPTYAFTPRARGIEVLSGAAETMITEAGPGEIVHPAGPSTEATRFPSSVARSEKELVVVRIGPVKLRMPRDAELDLELVMDSEGGVTYRGPHLEIGPLPFGTE